MKSSRECSSCILDSFANPILSGFLLGLEEEDYHYTVDPNFFSCCSGSAERFHSSKNWIERCDLKTRLNRVNQLVAQFLKTYPKAKLSDLRLTGSRSVRLLRTVSDVLKGYIPQAQIIEAVEGDTFSLWHMALLCTWRFGINAHVMTINDKASSARLPSYHTIKGPIAMFVEKLDKPWDPRHIEQLQVCVASAYNHNVFLWIELLGCVFEDSTSQLKNNTEQSQQFASTIDKINRRVKSIKRWNVSNELDLDCLSRLQSMRTLPLNLQQGDFDDLLV